MIDEERASADGWSIGRTEMSASQSLTSPCRVRFTSAVMASSRSPTRATCSFVSAIRAERGEVRVARPETIPAQFRAADRDLRGTPGTVSACTLLGIDPYCAIFATATDSFVLRAPRRVRTPRARTVAFVEHFRLGAQARDEPREDESGEIRPRGLVCLV